MGPSTGWLALVLLVPGITQPLCAFAAGLASEMCTTADIYSDQIYIADCVREDNTTRRTSLDLNECVGNNHGSLIINGPYVPLFPASTLPKLRCQYLQEASTDQTIAALLASSIPVRIAA